MREALTAFCLLCIAVSFYGPAYSLTIDESLYTRLQKLSSTGDVGDRIAFWAEQFVGTPYDPDPLGAYVRRDVIVADDRVDCMYLTFRSVELATSANLSDAIERALELRFKGQGKLDRHGKVINYGERFSYGIDMVFSGKWGRNVTAELSPTVSIQGSRGRERVGMISRESAAEAIPRLRSGDLLFFVKDPSRRRVGEIIGHIGIVSVAPDGIFLIHASGEKDGEGSVKKVRLEDYLRTMPFVGLVVTRLDGY